MSYSMSQPGTLLFLLMLRVWSAHAFIIQLILASFAKVASLEFTEWGV